MANGNLEDILRNLIVFLKGQIPSLQSRHSASEVVHHVQNITSNIRTAISQVEGASSFDPRSSMEYRGLAKELETLKGAYNQLEESLFLEKNKNEQGTGDHGKETTARKEMEKRAGEADRRAFDLSQEVARLQDELKNRPATGTVIDPVVKLGMERSLADAEKKRDVLQKTLQEKETELKEWKSRVMASELALSRSISEKIDLETRLSILGKSELHLQARIQELQENTHKEIDAQRQKAVSNEFQLLKAKKEVEALMNQETVKNFQASSDAKIKFYEKSVDDLKKLLKEKEQMELQIPEQYQNIQREKMRLEQQVIDLEAMVRRLSAERFERTTSGTPGNGLGPEDNVFFFEILTQIISRLPETYEFKELRSKAGEGIALLEKNKVVELIPTVGHVFSDAMHKVVRSYQSGILEDGTIIYEVNRGFRHHDQVVQRALVWIVKSRFRCTSCATMSRPQDNFCPKCGLELCTPDGISKRKLLPLPPTPEICLPLIDSLMDQANILKAEELLNNIPLEKQESPLYQKRRARLRELKTKA